MNKDITRRDFLRNATALGALGLSGCVNFPLGARANNGSEGNEAAAGQLPEQGEFVIRNAYVMTMDAGTGDLADADVHVNKGAIVAVGRGIAAPGAQVIDGRGMIVLPGLIETHWHMWNTLLRSMSGDKREHGYFPTALALGKVYLPGDMYQGARLSAAEALHSGITTVHDWCHNIRGPEYADADLRALRESGIRARFSYGAAQGQASDQPINLTDLRRVHRDWRSYSNDGLLTLGLAWRGVSTGATGSVSAAAYRQDFGAARELGIPISVHANNRKGADAIALLQSKRKQCPRHPFDVRIELAIGESDVLERHDQGFAIAVPVDGAVEILADRLVQQGCRRSADNVRKVAHE